MSEQKWVKPVRFAPKGHKFFVQDGGVCVADDSGDTPDQTDDGPLWVDVTRPATVGVYGVSLPVTKPGDDHEYYVGVTVQCLRGLLAVLPLQVTFREGVQSMFDALRDIDRLRARPSLRSLLKVVGVVRGETLYEWAAPPAPPPAPPAPEAESHWLTEPLAKLVLGVSSQTLEDWRCEGRIKYRFDFDGAPEYKLSTALPTPGVAEEAGPRGSVGIAEKADPAPDSKPVWLSKRLAMEVLGVAGGTLYDWRRKGRIKYVFNKATRTYEYEVSTAPKRYSRK